MYIELLTEKPGDNASDDTRIDESDLNFEIDLPLDKNNI